MIDLYHINPNSDIPIYQQLVDKIRAEIRMGNLVSGEQLPTVQTMADGLGIARGTIKRAYDELEWLGLVVKIQGRGTFVCYQEPSPDGRKDQALLAIDTLLDKLADLGFSMTEISVFLNLKLKEREENVPNVQVAVIECNPETLSRMTEQMRGVEGIDLHSYLLSGIQAYPYNWGEDMDLVITTVEHAAYLETILPEQNKIARIALRLSPESMAKIVKLQAGGAVGILGCSQRFGDLLFTACSTYTENVCVDNPLVINGSLDLADYFSKKTAVLVPDNFEEYTNPEETQILQQYDREGKLIRCFYEMDEGSFLYLQEYINRLRERK